MIKDDFYVATKLNLKWHFYHKLRQHVSVVQSARLRTQAQASQAAAAVVGCVYCAAASPPHSTAGPKISKMWRVCLILNFLIWASWMERCINVVFMNLFVNINKQYQNNCLSIIHFKSFTDGSFKFSLQQGTIGMFLSNFNLFKIRYLFL